MQHRESRRRLGLPVVALVGYTNAGKSSLLNKLSRAGVLAEDMLFATLDPTTRKVHIPRGKSGTKVGIDEDEEMRRFSKGQEILLTDTVGFIAKLPTDLIAAFRATLEEVLEADVLIHVCDRFQSKYYIKYLTQYNITL
jgi:GTP-binding protein HflX